MGSKTGIASDSGFSCILEYILWHRSYMGKASKDHSTPPRLHTAIHESEANFRIFAEMTASSIFIFQGRRLKYANPAMEVLTGYTREELSKISYRSLLPLEKGVSILQWAKRIMKGEDLPPRGEFRIIAKGGEERWIDLVIAIIDYEGKPAAFGTAFDITERKRAEILQDAVYRIAQAADRSKRLDDLFPALHAIISEVMPANNFYIALKDTESDLILFPYSVDAYDEHILPQKPGKGLTDYVMNTGKSLLCTIEKHNELERAGEIELIGTQSPIWLGVPLSMDGTVIGAMAVQDYNDATAFGVREQRILEFVSSQVALVITRKRAEDSLRENENRLRRRADELSALYETTREISSQRDTETLLQTIVDRAVKLLNSAGGAIYLWNDDSDGLEIKVAHGHQGLVGIRVAAEEDLVGQVAQLLQPMALDDYRLWPNRSSKYDAVPMTATMAAPMLYGGELVGVLSVYEVETGTGEPVRKYTEFGNGATHLFRRLGCHRRP